MDLITAIDLLTSPTYFYLPDEDGYTVTRMEKKENTYKKTNYLITDDRCSCMSWMKVKKCKHLDWLVDNYERLGEGVGAATCVAILEETLEKVKDIFPDSRYKWGIDTTALPATINAITLPFTEPLEFTKLVHIANTNLALTFYRV